MKQETKLKKIFKTYSSKQVGLTGANAWSVCGEAALRLKQEVRSSSGDKWQIKSAPP